MTPNATVVIPTFGDARHLEAVLGGLAKQNMRDFDVIVIDNNRHRSLSRALFATACIPAVLVHEPRNGLVHARNTGVRHATGRFIAFLDDDAVPTPTWLSELTSGLERYQSAVAGGSVTLHLGCDPPRWLGAAERTLLSELTYDGLDVPVLGDDMYIVGANMCIRRDAFDRFGLFSNGFGRTATSLRSSEELEFTRRLQSAGERISFVASAVVQHQIEPFRLTTRYMRSRSYWQGRSDALLEARWGRPESFGRRNWKMNVEALLLRLKAHVFERDSAARAASQFALAREFGYCLQAWLLTRYPHCRRHRWEV